MNIGNKLFAGALFAASVGFAIKVVKDIRDLKKEEEEIMGLAEEVFEDECKDEAKN